MQGRPRRLLNGGANTLSDWLQELLQVSTASRAEGALERAVLSEEASVLLLRHGKVAELEHIVSGMVFLKCH